MHIGTMRRDKCVPQYPDFCGRCCCCYRGGAGAADAAPAPAGPTHHSSIPSHTLQSPHSSCVRAFARAQVQADPSHERTCACLPNPMDYRGGARIRMWHAQTHTHRLAQVHKQHNTTAHLPVKAARAYYSASPVAQPRREGSFGRAGCTGSLSLSRAGWPTTAMPPPRTGGSGFGGQWAGRIVSGGATARLRN